MSLLNQIMERESIVIEENLHNLYKMFKTNGQGKAAKIWLEGDLRNIFLEFTVLQNQVSVFAKNYIDLIASKCYYPNGIVVMCIYFRGVFYMGLADGIKEQPLLDSTFPCLE